MIIITNKVALILHPGFVDLVQWFALCIQDLVDVYIMDTVGTPMMV
jgi:hypothetical protein